MAKYQACLIPEKCLRENSLCLLGICDVLVSYLSAGSGSKVYKAKASSVHCFLLNDVLVYPL